MDARRYYSRSTGTQIGAPPGCRHSIYCEKCLIDALSVLSEVAEVREKKERRRKFSVFKSGSTSEAAEMEAAVVAEAPWSVAEWAVALRFDHPRATVLVLLLR